MEEYFNTINRLIHSTRKMFDQLNAICMEENINDLNMNQVCIVCHMQPNKEYRVKDLGDLYPLTNISYNLNGLCKGQYLQKKQSKSDLRETSVVLIKKGEKLYNLMKNKLVDPSSIEIVRAIPC